MPDIRNEDTVAATLLHCHTVAVYHTSTLPHSHTVASARPVGELDSAGLARQQNIFKHIKCWNDGMGIDQWKLIKLWPQKKSSQGVQ